jgi:hypothetical protein
MYITLTNASALHTGAKIAININLIATVHTALIERDPDVWQNVTFIFCPPHGTWEVSESHEEVVTQLNSLLSTAANNAALIAVTRSGIPNLTLV